MFTVGTPVIPSALWPPQQFQVIYPPDDRGVMTISSQVQPRWMRVHVSQVRRGVTLVRLRR